MRRKKTYKLIVREVQHVNLVLRSCTKHAYLKNYRRWINFTV